MTVSELYIGGVQMPTPALEGVTVTSEKIWSADTGRSASGKMLGTCVAVKAKISVKWPPLTPAQAAVIEGAVSDPDKPFVTMKYTDMAGNTVTKEVYFGTPSYTWYSWSDGVQYLKDVSVDGVER